MTRVAISVLLTCSFFLPTCKKDSGNTPGIIEGNWELLRISGSRATVNYPAGNGNLLKFTNSSYEVFENSQKVKSGTYTIIDDPSAPAAVCLILPSDQYRKRIIYDDDYNASKKFFQISKDTLSIISGCFASDAGTNVEYLRR